MPGADAQENRSEYCDASLQRDFTSVLYAYMLSAKQQLSGSNQQSQSSPSEKRNESLKDAARSVSEYAEKSLATEVPSTDNRAVKSKDQVVEMDFQSDAARSVSEYAEKSLAAEVPSTSNQAVKSKDQVVEMDFQHDARACASEYADEGLAAQKKRVKESVASANVSQSAPQSQNVVFGNPISAEVLVRRSQQVPSGRQVMPTLANGQLFLVPAGNDGLQTALPSAFDEMAIATIPNSAAQMNFVHQCLAKMKLFLGAEFAKFERFYNEHVGHTEEDNDLMTAVHGQPDPDLITAVEVLGGLKQGLLDSDLITSVDNTDSDLKTAVEHHIMLKTAVEQTD
uniref:Uncharacterized protein n=1 Tax=Ditylenchus dipsaci TaxID=166011 RepID=A0A915ES88_9BILA